MKYLLCLGCHHAWNALDWHACPECGDAPVECSPWSGADSYTWFCARAQPKAAGIYETLATDNRYKRKVLLKRARARGNTVIVWTARAWR